MQIADPLHLLDKNLLFARIRGMLPPEISPSSPDYQDFMENLETWGIAAMTVVALARHESDLPLRREDKIGLNLGTEFLQDAVEGEKRLSTKEYSLDARSVIRAQRLEEATTVLARLRQGGQLITEEQKTEEVLSSYTEALRQLRREEGVNQTTLTEARLFFGQLMSLCLTRSSAMIRFVA